MIAKSNAQCTVSCTRLTGLGLGAHAKWLYVVLADEIKARGGRLQMCVAQMAALAEMSKSTVKRAVAALEAAGLITVIRNRAGLRYGVNVYSLADDDATQPGFTESSEDDASGVRESPREDDFEGESGFPMVQREPGQGSERTGEENNKNKNIKSVVVINNKHKTKHSFGEPESETQDGDDPKMSPVAERLVGLGVNRFIAKRYAGESPERVEAVIKYCQGQKPGNLAGMIVKALSENWAVAMVASKVSGMEKLADGSGYEDFSSLDRLNDGARYAAGAYAAWIDN